MTMREKLDSMYFEKAILAKIHIASQLKEASKIDGLPTVYDLVNSDDEDEYMIITSVEGEWFTVNIADPGCNSIFVDGDWGWYDPDETKFYSFKDYGKTWVAAPWKEIVAEEGWPKMVEIQKLLK